MHIIDIIIDLQNKASSEAKKIEQDMNKTKESTEGLTRSMRHNSSEGQSWGQKMATATGKMGDGFIKGGNKMQDFGKKYRGMSVATLGYTAKLAQAQSEYSRTITSTSLANEDYQNGSKTLGQVTEETKGKVDELSQSFRTFKKQEIAEQFLNISRAGYNGKDAMDVMEASMRLATARGEDLGNMTEILIRAMGAFGMESTQAGEAATILASAANASTMNVGDMTQALNMVGAVAHDSGVTLKETADAIGFMHDKGIQASTGARSLRTVLAGLNEAGSDQNEMLQELGMEVDDLGRVKYANLADFVEKYQNATKNMSDEEKSNMAIKLAGKEAYAGFLALTSEAGEAVDEYGNKIAGSNKTLKDFSEQTAEFTEGDLKKMQEEIEKSDPWSIFKAQLSNTSLALGEALAPSLVKALEKLGVFLEKLQDPEYAKFIGTVIKMAAKFAIFSQVVGVTGKAVTGTGQILKGVSSVMGFLTGSTTKGAGAFKLFSGSGKLLGTAFGLLTSKTVLIAGGIGALVTIVVKAYKEFDWFRDIVDKTMEFFGKIVASVIKYVVERFEKFIGTLGKAIDWVSKFGSKVGSVFKKSSDDTAKNTDKMSKSVEKNTKKASDSAGKNSNKIGSDVDKGTGKARDSAKRNSDKIAQDITENTSKAASQANTNMLAMSKTVDENTSKVNKSVKNMSSTISKQANQATKNFNSSFSKMGSGASKNMDATGKTVQTGMNRIGKMSENGGKKASTSFVRGFRPIVSNSRSVANEAARTLRSTLGGINLYYAGSSAMASFARGLRSQLSSVSTAATNARNASKVRSQAMLAIPTATNLSEEIQASGIGFSGVSFGGVFESTGTTISNNYIKEDSSPIGSSDNVNIVIYESFDGDKITRTVNSKNARDKVRIKTVRG